MGYTKAELARKQKIYRARQRSRQLTDSLAKHQARVAQIEIELAEVTAELEKLDDGMLVSNVRGGGVPGFDAAFMKSLRLDRGMSQADFSRKSGIAQTYVCRLEKGETNPTLSTLRKLAKALGARPEAFVS